MQLLPTAGVIGLGRSDYQWAVGGSVSIEGPENGENSENPAKIFEVSLDPV